MLDDKKYCANLVISFLIYLPVSTLRMAAPRTARTALAAPVEEAPAGTTTASPGPPGWFWAAEDRWQGPGSGTTTDTGGNPSSISPVREKRYSEGFFAFSIVRSVCSCCRPCNHQIFLLLLRCGYFFVSVSFRKPFASYMYGLRKILKL